MPMTPERLLPSHPLPPYTYIPGKTPHPISDPAGHMASSPRTAPPAIDPARWRESATYFHALDLFNAGYYWEAHETWESLWHAAGRTGDIADLLKGLIQLAASGVKVREGIAEGVRNLAAKAERRFRGLPGPLLGFEPAELIEAAQQASATPPDPPGSESRPRAVFPFVLCPGLSGKG